MKKTLFISIQLILSCFSIRAQVNMVPNPGFEFGIGYPGCISDSKSDFDFNIDYWRCAFTKSCCIPLSCLSPNKCPTPDWIDKNICASKLSNILQEPPPFSPSNRFAQVLKDGEDFIEGIRTSIAWNLVPHNYYKIRLRIAMGRGSVPKGGRLKVHFAEYSDHWFTQGDLMSDVATFIIHPNQEHKWYTFEFTFYHSWSSTQLGNMVLMRDIADADNSFLYVDDVELYELNGFCPPQFFVENKTYVYPELNADGSVKSYEAANKLMAGYDVHSLMPNGPVKLESTASIAYKAGKQVGIKPGFQASRGSNFRAYIADCGRECKVPLSNIGPLREITLCAGGTPCYDIGAPPRYGEIYEWRTPPGLEWSLNFLSDKYASNPKLCIPTHLLPDFGALKYYLRVSNRCGEVCTCDESILIKYDVTGLNRTPAISVNYTKASSTDGIFETNLNTVFTAGVIAFEIYYTTDFLSSNPVWNAYHSGINNPLSAERFFMYEGVDYERNMLSTFTFDVKTIVTAPPFKFKFKFIALNHCGSAQQEVYSGIYEYVGQ